MNDKLILTSLNWIISNTKPVCKESEDDREELLDEIIKILNPPKQPTIAERKHDALSQKTEVKN